MLALSPPHITDYHKRSKHANSDYTPFTKPYKKIHELTHRIFCKPWKPIFIVFVFIIQHYHHLSIFYQDCLWYHSKPYFLKCSPFETLTDGMGSWKLTSTFVHGCIRAISKENSDQTSLSCILWPGVHYFLPVTVVSNFKLTHYHK